MSQSSPTRSSPSLLPRVVKAVGAAVALTVGAVAAANVLVSATTPQLSPRLRGQFGRYPARFGDVAYTVAGTGKPLLLLHGLDAGRSMAEWRGVFEILADHHTVYAFDWLGWGISDPARDGYSAAEFSELVENFIRDIIGEPTAVLAAGQGGIFAILAAARGAQISRLGLICPVPPAFDSPSGQSRAEALLQGALAGSLMRAPVVGTGLVNGLRSRKVLEKWSHDHGFWNKERAEQEVKTLHVTAHQDANGNGLRNFMLGTFDADWREAWSELKIPALLVWGRQAVKDGLDTAPEWLALQPNAQLEVLEDSLLLPHLEVPESFAEKVVPWLSSVD